MAPAAKLFGVHPELVQRVERMLEAMEALGFPMLVTDGVRTAPQQMALWRKGRSEPGSIVTNADGINRRSNHQPWPDGFGHAVDCAFLVDGQPSWANDRPWRLYGEMAKALKLKWGGDWKGFVDRPHIELP